MWRTASETENRFLAVFGARHVGGGHALFESVKRFRWKTKGD
jgi:hypothetical protein